MNPWKLVGYAFLGLLVVGGVFAWNRRKNAQYEAEKAVWEQKLKASDSTLAVVVEQRNIATAQNAQSRTIYLEGKTRIIRESQGTPAAPAVQACFELADIRISKCEASRKADSLVIVAQQGKIKTLEEKPERQLPRYQPYAEALYSITESVPVIRAGATGKLLGPIDLSLAGEYSAPPSGESKPQFRALAGIRVRF